MIRTTRFSVLTKGLLSAAVVSLLPVHAIEAGAQSQNGLPAILSDPAVMAKNPLPDFSYAGYEYGNAPIPQVTTAIKASDYGAIPDDGRDDSAALKAAVAAAVERGGLVRVQLDKGRYQLTEILWLEHSNIVLAGAGMGEGGTEIYMPRPLNQVDDGGALEEMREYMVVGEKRARNTQLNIDRLFSEYSWSGGFVWARVPGGRPAEYETRFDPVPAPVAKITAAAKFARTLTVADASGLAVGEVIKVKWYNREGPDGPLLKSLYGDTELPIGEAHWITPERPLIEQATRIEAISGNTVTIADPLMHPVSADLPADFERWDHISNIGIEDMAFVFPKNPYFFHHNESGFNAIYLTGVHNGWVRNVRVAEADSAILTDDSANVTISNFVTQGDQKGHYGVHISRSHNMLVDGAAVFNDTHHSLSFNTGATRSVIKNSVVWTSPSLDQHSGANEQNLYDNITVHVTPTNQKAADGSAIVAPFHSGGGIDWQPGAGRYNTIWNLNVLVTSGVAPGSPVVVQAPSNERDALTRPEGPDARVVGLHGNRPLTLNYAPQPYVELHGTPVLAVPSLHGWQLAQRHSK